MIEYLFRAKDGEELTRLYDPEKVPGLFKWIRVKGKRFQRVYASGPGAGIVKEESCVAHTLPRRWAPGMEQIHDKWTEHGVAVVTGKQDRRNLELGLARMGRPFKFDPS